MRAAPQTLGAVMPVGSAAHRRLLVVTAAGKPVREAPAPGKARLARILRQYEGTGAQCTGESGVARRPAAPRMARRRMWVGVAPAPTTDV